MSTVDCCIQTDEQWFRYRTGAIIVENNAVLFATGKSVDYLYTIGGGVHIGETAEECVVREVFEETGVSYEIDHLAVVLENFFTGHGGNVDKLDCHCLELYFVMKSRGCQQLNGHSINADGDEEKLHWIPLDKLQDYNIKPSFLKDRLDEILNSKSILHIVSQLDRK